MSSISLKLTRFRPINLTRNFYLSRLPLSAVCSFVPANNRKQLQFCNLKFGISRQSNKRSWYSTSAELNKYEFKAETSRLLDIVARSLYSDKEVFLRELISNASDSLEKQRLLQAHTDDKQDELEIHIQPNPVERTLVISDNGRGMSKDELITYLGTIAHSGSKEFAEKLSSANEMDLSKIIGRFGVGFYSTFMVADKIEVFSKSRDHPNEAWHWQCDGSSCFTIGSVDPNQISQGTKVVLHLKNECTDFLQTEKIKEIVRKYSNFVHFPIKLNDDTVNDRKPIWLESPNNLSEQDHEQFFQLLTKSKDESPRYTVHYQADAPLCIRAILYIPKTSSPLASMLKEQESGSVGLALYNRQVLITPHAKALLPPWLNFVKGVVDCEDIPLNLSREMMQDNQLISRLRIILTNRIIRYLQDERRKNEDNYHSFYKDYSLYLKEAIVRSADQNEKHSISQLLLFQSSSLDENKYTTLSEYIQRMRPGQSDIYYIAGPSRSLALSSPYFENFKQRKEECLVLCNTHDELVILQLNDFTGKRIRSIEQETSASNLRDDSILVGDASALTNEESQSLKQWFIQEYTSIIKSARINLKLDKHPVAITASHIGSIRQYLRSPLAKQQKDFDLFSTVPLNLEFNPRHDLIKKIHSLRSTNASLANQLGKQLIDNALVIAGISEDPILTVCNFNDLLCKFINTNNAK